MGQVARELGYAGPLAAPCHPAIGIEWQCRTLQHRLRAHRGDIRVALASYNGGANLHYADEVPALAENYRIPSARLSRQYASNDLDQFR